MSTPKDGAHTSPPPARPPKVEAGTPPRSSTPSQTPSRTPPAQTPSQTPVHTPAQTPAQTPAREPPSTPLSAAAASVASVASSIASPARNGSGRKSVAVVGSGIAGHATAFYLRRTHDVTVFEADARAGGHAHTVDVDGIPVDVGFQVFNHTNYPYLSALLDDLEVYTVASDMSLSASVRPARGAPFEWSSVVPFPTFWSWFSLTRWLLFLGILWFEQEARAFLERTARMDVEAREEAAKETAAQWLDRRGYSRRFRTLYFYPTVASIWSAPNGGVDDFSALAVLAFMANHFLLHRTRPRWRTLKHRSQDYVAKLHKALPPGTVRLGERVAAVKKSSSGALTLLGPGGRTLGGRAFDAVVFACHAPQALAALKSPKTKLPSAAALRAALEPFKTVDNAVVVHTDASLLPRARNCWSAWNYAADMPAAGASAGASAVDRAVTVTYYANMLQGVQGPEGKEDILVSLNPPAGAIDPAKVVQTLTSAHPLLSAESVAARPALAEAQGTDGVYFAGAWTESGFHEDGVRSAVKVARLLGADVPDPGPGPPPGLHPLTRRFVLPILRTGFSRLYKRGTLRLVLPTGAELLFGDGSPCAFDGDESIPGAFGETNNGSWAGCEEVCVRVKKERALWRMVADPGMGLAEAYVAGEVAVVPDIVDLFRASLLNAQWAISKKATVHDSPLALASTKAAIGALWNAALHALQPNSVRGGSRRNVSAHYDLSNDMFKAFLDETMTYSSGIFDDAEAVKPLSGDPGKDEKLLHDSQIAKLDAMLDLLDLKAGDRVLEIGCGWGSLAIRAAKRFDIEWVGITLSTEQLEEARARVKAAGLEGRVRLEVCDYRNAAKAFGAGCFDKVASVEMIEAVGHAYLLGYFKAIEACLRPGGVAAIQAIVVPDSRYESYRRGSDFIRKHIFPGGHLSCPGYIRTCAQGAKLAPDEESTRSLALSYAKTLRIWRARFAAKLPEITAMQAAESVKRAAKGGISVDGAFNAEFGRKFEYYFAICEAGFGSRHIDVLQLRFAKPGAPPQPAGANADAGAARTRLGQVKGGGAFYDANAPVLASNPAVGKGIAARVLAPLLWPATALAHAAWERFRAVGHQALDMGLCPDFLARPAIRLFIDQKAKELRREVPDVETQMARTQTFVAELKAGPIAVHTDAANEQHYEVAPEYYDICLGPRRKYSCCKFPPGARVQDAAKLLPAAEEASLAEVVERAGLADGMHILDLGCGWGSGALYYAEKLPNAKVVGVSNSNAQREHILADAKRKGLTNIDIVTADVSKGTFVAKAKAALRGLCKNAEGIFSFDRVVTIEMFEHMKNYEQLLKLVSDALLPGGLLFVHIFVHKTTPYHFIAKSESDWMARYFFAGGTMPSDDLLHYFQRDLSLVKQWRVSGWHYMMTSEAWLQRMDARRKEVRKIFADAYPKGQDLVWWVRWRAFYIAVAELFGYSGGNEWHVAHYLFKKPEKP